MGKQPAQSHTAELGLELIPTLQSLPSVHVLFPKPKTSEQATHVKNGVSWCPVDKGVVSGQVHPASPTSLPQPQYLSHSSPLGQEGG